MDDDTAHETPIEAVVVSGDDKREHNRWLQSRGAVLAMMFLVTGVFGIPLLWINKQFTAAERVFWSVVVTIYTLLLLVIVACILWWMWQRTMNAIYPS